MIVDVEFELELEDEFPFDEEEVSRTEKRLNNELPIFWIPSRHSSVKRLLLDSSSVANIHDTRRPYWSFNFSSCWIAAEPVSGGLQASDREVTDCFSDARR